jgi:Protein of unknown function DUF262
MDREIIESAILNQLGSERITDEVMGSLARHPLALRIGSREDSSQMSLQEEIAEASKKVIKDGYDMSIGELINLYRDRELFINPKYQRYFRWDESQKTRFIETLLLGIPIPPIFVYTTGKKWEIHGPRA